MKFLKCLVLLTIISCGGGEVRKNVDEVGYQTSGIEQFILPQLPEWANYSAAGRCFKLSPFSYLDFKKISVSYQLSYEEMLELQAQYNERLESYFRSSSVRFLKPMEEASFFSNTLEQVRGGVRTFRLPQVKDVDVIWIDSFRYNDKIDEIKKMAEAGKFDERLPILFSSCLSKQNLTQWISEQNLDQVGFYILGAEWLNPHGSDLELQPGLRIELKKIISPQVKINIISAEMPHVPNELIIK